jgi:hypothetical protein
MSAIMLWPRTAAPFSGTTLFTPPQLRPQPLLPGIQLRGLSRVSRPRLLQQLLQVSVFREQAGETDENEEDSLEHREEEADNAENDEKDPGSVSENTHDRSTHRPSPHRVMHHLTFRNGSQGGLNHGGHRGHRENPGLRSLRFL